MKIFKTLFIGIIVICLTTISCNGTKTDPETIEVTGIIQQTGVTSYQYGTHTISGYAIRSSTITLDDYVDQNVTIIGKKIEGYPVDGGPDYIDVEEIK